MKNPANPTVVDALASALAEAGVQRVFGVPGGGSSLDLIEAAANHGIDFVLASTENAAVMMAGAVAETTGVPGVALVTKGPGVANAVNGVAYASLDRAPVVVVTDGFTDGQQRYVTHQVFDQRALLAPLVKGHSRLEGATAGGEIRRLIALATTRPYGPVHVELTGEAARARLPDALPPAEVATMATTDDAAIAAARRLLSGARRPVVIVGLEARAHAPAIRRFVAGLRCPVLPTYKAKGVVPDASVQVTGVFTGGAQEAECVDRADLIVLLGVDPVELIVQPWRYRVPVVEIAVQRYPVHYVTPAVALHGSIDDALARLGQASIATDWSAAQIAALRAGVLDRLSYGEVRDGIAPDRAVQLTAQAFGQKGIAPRMAVDAGAHMFSATAFFPCGEPGDVLISNGLATMAFALPAAIAAALADPQRPVVCFTGDGGLMMCLGELRTAVETSARVVVIVFNDGSLSLIDIKQQSRGLPSRGVRRTHHDFARSMEAAGAVGWSARTEAELRAALDQALSARGPCLIDVRIDPVGYGRQLKAMRG